MGTLDFTAYNEYYKVVYSYINDMESNSRRSFLQLAATLGALAPSTGKAAAHPAEPPVVAPAGLQAR